MSDRDVTRAARGYRIALVPPWTRINLGPQARDQVQALVDRVAELHTPQEVPPDQVGPKKRAAVEAMMAQVDAAREHGGIDLYVPLGDLHGYVVQAAFTVSQVVPSTTIDTDEVPGILRSLLTDPSAEPVTIADTVWVRRLRHVAAADDVAAPSRRVDYVTALPGSARHWIVASYATSSAPITDGDAGSDLLIELFDATMTTWRWLYDDQTEEPMPTQRHADLTGDSDRV